MLVSKNEQVFLPVWRGGRIIFFTNIVGQDSTRVSYFAAAASAPGQTEIIRTGKAPITGDQLRFCQNIADDGVNLQKFFSAMGAGNLDHFTVAMNEKKMPFPQNTNPLIFTCLYLDFLRKYAVDSEIIRIYSESPVADRFDVDRSVGIYKTLASRLQSDVAEMLLDSDLEGNKRPWGSSMMIANLLRECAIIKFDLGKFEEAENYMLRAVKLHNTEDKWRRLGDFANAAGDQTKTVRYFLNASKIKPLPAPAALILGRCMVELGEFENARKFVDQAAEVFVKPAENLTKRINAAQQKSAK